jgi:hypothetical protein
VAWLAAPLVLRRPAAIAKKSPRLVRLGFGMGLGDSLLSHGKLPHYHRRQAVSLPGSGWVRVGHARYGHQANGCSGGVPHCHVAGGRRAPLCRLAAPAMETCTSFCAVRFALSTACRRGHGLGIACPALRAPAPSHGPSQLGVMGSSLTGN